MKKKFGILRSNLFLKWGTFKFGQDSRFYIFENIIKYLPSYIVVNQLCKDLIKPVAIELTRWYNELVSLKKIRFKKGYPSLKYANSDLQLFVHPNISTDELQYCIKNYLAIHKKRGTKTGIIEDLKRFTGDDGCLVEFYDYDDSGWILDKTFPMYKGPDTISLDTPCYLDNENFILIKFKNKSGYSDEDAMRIIRANLLPLSAHARIVVKTPHIVKWGEVRNGNKLKFGIFKFGEVTNE